MGAVCAHAAAVFAAQATILLSVGLTGFRSPQVLAQDHHASAEEAAFVSHAVGQPVSQTDYGDVEAFIGRLRRYNHCPNSTCTLVFVHVPKTGGTSILQGLMRHCEETGLTYTRCMRGVSNRTCRAPKAIAPPPGRPGSAHILAGHLAYDVNRPRRGLRRLSRDAFASFTILREPLERLVSFYNFEQDARLTFSQWYTLAREKLCNLQVAYMAGLHSGPNFAENGRCLQIDREHLQLAKRHLVQNITLAGVHNCYQQFIAALGCTFNISAGARELLVRSHEVPRHQPRNRAPLRPETLQRLGITPSEPPSLATNFTRIAVGDVSPETRRQVIADNALDVELVDFTYGLWRHRWPRLRTMCASA